MLVIIFGGYCGFNLVIGDQTVMIAPLTPSVSKKMEDVSQVIRGYELTDFQCRNSIR